MFCILGLSAPSWLQLASFFPDKSCFSLSRCEMTRSLCPPGDPSSALMLGAVWSGPLPLCSQGSICFPVQLRPGHFSAAWVSPTSACSVKSNSLRPPWTSPPGSSVHGILQARILELVAFPTPGESSQPGIKSCISCIGRQSLYHDTTGEIPLTSDLHLILYLSCSWRFSLCFKPCSAHLSPTLILYVFFKCYIL